MSQLTLWQRIRPTCIWGLAAFFFFAHYVVRVTPGQIIEQLQAYFDNVTKYEIGLLGAAFYLPYVLMQMPVGYLVDRFGPRNLLTGAVFVCSLSCLLFSMTPYFSLAILSRVLLGFCSAAAFIGALKLATVWFKPQYLALLVGITQALGMLGASLGSALVPYLNTTIGWQNTFLGYAILFLILSLFIFKIVRNSPSASQGTEAPHLPSLDLMKKVLTNRYTWINALYAGFIYAPTDAMGELWGKEFLRNIHQINSYTASFAISLLFIGWGIGGPLVGWLADHWGRRPIMIISAVCGAILLPILFYVPHLPDWVILGVAFLYGLTNTGLVASYTVAGELHHKELSGFSMAIANMFSILIGASLMPIIGKVLQLSLSSHTQNALSYNIKDYQMTALILPVCSLLAILFALWSKETMKIKGKTYA